MKPKGLILVYVEDGDCQLWPDGVLRVGYMRYY